ncbi:hypothetical protein LOZ61_006783 [Ophidiomyces ophidiicola]|nr:hypothetical protein LOZ61_006783 [Ophidiomyces ophidiicola]
MQSDISYTNLQSRVRSGAVIRWCGMTQDDRVLVQLIEHDETEHVVVDVNHIINVWPTNGVLRNGEALEPLLDVGYTPSNSDAFATLRKATVLGINISGDCEVGSAKPYTRLEGCTCGYDIELDLRDEQREGFPLPDTPVLSVALWCSCGFRYFISTMDINLDYCYTAKSQQAIVAKFIDVLSDHTPLWLVGWNCYSFDNTCLVYHASSSARKLFRKVKIGSASTVDYGYILDMPGIYNVDPFGYMQRSAGYSKIYMDLSLYGVAMRLGTTMKTEMPDLYTVSDPVEILEYNMNDSAIAAEIWTKTGLVTEIPSLAIGSCSHVYDCIRHMTSVTARCPYTTEALKVGMMIDWSPCRSLSEYSGGKVFEPIRGLHKDVVICDFSSMYPTIMIDANISPETIEVRDPDNNAYGNVWFDESRTYVRLDDCVTSFPVDAPSIQRDILIKYVKLRNENRKTNPVYAGTLKVVANSVYGATGYENSPMYSPLCSSSVTAIGRWSLERACSIFEQYGLKVIYGDTDSCFIAATHVTHAKFRGDVRRHAMSCLTRIKEFFCGTPLKNMNMSLESYHERTLLIEKKKYCATVDNGNIIYKGMSIVRRDTLGICKKACETVTKSILYSSSMKEANDLIARFVNGIVSDILNNRLSHSDVSKIAKRNQKRCYVYTGEDGLERSYLTTICNML